MSMTKCPHCNHTHICHVDDDDKVRQLELTLTQTERDYRRMDAEREVASTALSAITKGLRAMHVRCDCIDLAGDVNGHCREGCGPLPCPTIALLDLYTLEDET